MTEDVVVLGSGYAGAGAIKSLEQEISNRADITWISDVDHHLVLHEVHRCIRDPELQRKVSIPINEIKSSDTEFIQGTVTTLDPDERTIHLDDGSTVEYDYCVVGIGSRTAFFGIDGLKQHSHTLKSLQDALLIHDDIKSAAKEASRTDPASVVVGGAGLSGIQSAGEIAMFRDQYRAPLDIYLVEGLDSVYPPGDPEVQGKLTKMLSDRGINIKTGEFITEVDEETVYIGDETELDYDVLLWTGGITGQDCTEEIDLEKDDRSHRLHASSTFQTSDERVFAIGDTALVDQVDGDPAPPTAQAAWQAAEVIGENVRRTMRDQPLTTWTYDDKGTVISVGDAAVANNVIGSPIDTFGGIAAETLKKAIATRWINRVTSAKRAAKAWPDM
ncbi:NAD(P)/FAD-dependent oxidoreductase [Halocatena pleomorpha]|uniref:NAD(P)/FAD-dependent oxidoreductase n=1 Tax=Halocatena pleomorpha TaxID=1785090 RepID=A0A3P3RE82_9EURY|nr:NAD(P)/FAD-dependent oxidoreductase [Halocatena pleomorpha]RRJ31050.1 NAD(P)/FAD-dependent oxidoreductase [Halocatena pleomorpha]